MVTDITELAQREKFEAWWERTQHNGNPPRFGWECWRDGEGYKVDDDESELDGMWSAWKAAGAELVEALEKAQLRIDSQREYYDGVIADGGKRIAELESRTVTVKIPSTVEPSPFAPWIAKAFYQFHKDTVNSCVTVFSDACAAAGIKWEVE